MKKQLFSIFLFFSISVSGQNEFGATAFYSDLKKIFLDAETGFSELKGDIYKDISSNKGDVFKITSLLPLADSGKIIIPASGYPYAIYYFEPDKLRLKVDQRGANLRDAVALAYNKPLFARTETEIIGNHPYSNSWYFIKPDETNKLNAVFKMSIYFLDSKYFLTLEIRGKKI
ncbi:MAG: hypothetical protein WBC06_07680 [Chitinophagaceae bacterium]